MLETIREYGLEVLEALGDGDDARRAHAGYFMHLAEEAEPALKGPLLVAGWIGWSGSMTTYEQHCTGR